MPDLKVVCLCDQYDIKAQLGPAFAAQGAGISLLRPSEVTAPEAIRHAIAIRPGPSAFDPYPNLALVCCGGAGVDALLAHPGLRPGVAITRMTDPGQARMMAGFALYYVVGWHRRMWGYPGQQAAEKWEALDWTPPGEFPVGVLGHGKMGQAVARSLVGLGYPVMAWARHAAPVCEVEVVTGPAGLARLAGRCRAVVNTLPLTPETRGILSAAFFRQMAEDAILIQIGRGGHLVEEDLIAGLAAGRPALAALDVTAVEPLPRGHPFWQHPKIMLTPHVASEAAPADAARAIAAAIRKFEAGEVPEGLVDRRRGY